MDPVFNIILLKEKFKISFPVRNICILLPLPKYNFMSTTRGLGRMCHENKYGVRSSVILEPVIISDIFVKTSHFPCFLSLKLEKRVSHKIKES